MDMQLFHLCWLIATMSTVAADPAIAQSNAAAGKQLYQAQCSACHANQPGVNGIGPSLAGLAGRKAGSLSGFGFTPALQGSGLTWNAETFGTFLADPTKLVAGTAMTVAVADQAARADLFAYFATLKDTRAADQPGASAKPAAPKVTGPTQAELSAAATASDAWLYASHDYAGSRFVDLNQISAANAKELRPVCVFRSEQTAPVQTSPLVYQGVMYLTFGRATVAIDARTCRERWSHVWQPQGACSAAWSGTVQRRGRPLQRQGRAPAVTHREPEPAGAERAGRF